MLATSVDAKPNMLGGFAFPGVNADWRRFLDIARWERQSLGSSDVTPYLNQVVGLWI